MCIYDILVFIETNLSAEIHDSELGLQNFSIFRCDRSQANSAKDSGGGILIAVDTSLNSYQLPSAIMDIECLFVRIQLETSSLIIGSAYIPPNMPSLKYERFCDAVIDVASSNPSVTDFILLGDFNQPDTTWDDLSLCSPSLSSQNIINIASILHLYQHNKIKNLRGVILDLIFTPFYDTEVLPAADVIIPEDVNHPPLSFSFNIKNTNATSNSTISHNFRRCNMDAVFAWIQQLNYPIAASINAEREFTSFSQNFADIIRDNSPLKPVRQSSFPKWFSAELKRLVVKKKTMHRYFKETGDVYFYEEFKQTRSRCKQLAGECYRRHTDFVESTIPNNIKIFWSHIKSLKAAATPLCVRYEDRTATSPGLQCELFADFFKSVYTDVSLPGCSFDFETNTNINSITVTAQQVEEKLNALDPNKGMGPDCIPPAVVKYCSSVLAPHLSIYFNMLLETGVFPDNLKLSYVVPIFKSGNRADVANYRPIAIQPVFAKVFESLVLDILAFALKQTIVEEQHGFRSGKSTSTNLILLQSYIISAFNRHHQVDCILLDFSKAFDRISHSLLVSKLNGYGIGGPLLVWLSSYLSGRGLIVSFAGSVSGAFLATSGVPQGSHLAPFLFNLFLNDICKSIKSKCLMFADDIKVFLEVNQPEDCVQLQDTLDSVVAWCQQNGMSLNASKSAIITYSRSSSPTVYNYRLLGTTLSRVQKFKDLGVVMSADLSPWNHITQISNKANSLMGFICRAARDFQNPSTITTLYKTLIRPILEYSSIVWNPYQVGHIAALEQIQIRLIRLAGLRLGYQYFDVPVDRLRITLGLPLLENRRKTSDILFLHSLVNGVVDCPELLSKIEFKIPKTTRSQDIFCRRAMPSLYSQQSVIPRLMRLGNEVSEEVELFGSSKLSLRRRLIRVVSEII